jgi:hypothetical protein
MFSDQRVGDVYASPVVHSLGGLAAGVHDCFGSQWSQEANTPQITDSHESITVERQGLISREHSTAAAVFIAELDFVSGATENVR